MDPKSLEESRTVEQLVHNAEEILALVHRTGRPLTIVSENGPTAVLLDVAAFERLIHLVNLARLLNEGQADVLAGRTRPAEDVLRDLESGKKVSR